MYNPMNPNKKLPSSVMKQYVVDYCFKPGVKFFYKDSAGIVRSLVVRKIDKWDRQSLQVFDGDVCNMTRKEVVDKCFAFMVTPDSFFGKRSSFGSSQSFTPFIRRFK